MEITKERLERHVSFAKDFCENLQKGESGFKSNLLKKYNVDAKFPVFMEEAGIIKKRDGKFIATGLPIEPIHVRRAIELKSKWMSDYDRKRKRNLSLLKSEIEIIKKETDHSSKKIKTNKEKSVKKHVNAPTVVIKNENTVTKEEKSYFWGLFKKTVIYNK